MPGAADGEHVAPLVVLPLVDLVAVDAGDQHPEPGGGEADVEQPLVVVPGDLLAAGDADRGTGLDAVEQPLQGVRGRCAVVVQQPQPLARSGSCAAVPRRLVAADRDGSGD